MKLDLRVIRWRKSLQLGLLCSVLAYGEAMPQGVTTQVTDSAGVAISETRWSDQAATCEVSGELLRVGSATSDPSSELFGVRGAASLSTGSLAVLNAGTSQVKVFSPEGELTLEFGRSGEGPGEFRNIWSLRAGPDDVLMIGDYRPWRFSFFTSTGEYLSAVTPRPPIIERPAAGFAIPERGQFAVGEACCYDPAGVTDRMVSLQRFDEGGDLVDTIGVFEYDRFGLLNAEIGFVGTPIFGATAHFASFGDDEFLYAPGQQDQVEVRGAEGDLHRIIRWSARDRTVRSEDVEEWKRATREAYLERFPDSPMGPQVLEGRTGEDRPVAESFPSHEAIVAGRDSRIWVKEYRRPMDQGPERWLVFAQDGRAECEVRLPEGTELLEAGADYIIGLERDELDVESVVKWILREPSR